VKIITLFFLLLCSISAQASSLNIFTVKQPLFLQNTESEEVISIHDVPFVTAWAYPEATFEAISAPFIPPSDSSWKERKDVNLASLYGIRVSAADEGATWKITVDASKAKKPADYPFTIKQVTDAVVTCAKRMVPAKQKITLKIIAAK
jgi:hypothetical protein